MHSQMIDPAKHFMVGSYLTLYLPLIQLPWKQWLFIKAASSTTAPNPHLSDKKGSKTHQGMLHFGAHSKSVLGAHASPPFLASSLLVMLLNMGHITTSLSYVVMAIEYQKKN